MMPHQISIITDRSKIWTKQVFHASPSFTRKIQSGSLRGKVTDTDNIPGDSQIDPKGWDHEHCQLCMETISDYPNYQHEGFVNGKDWLCCKCYDQYILPQLNTEKE